MNDRDGLDEAYKDPRGVYTAGDTLYVAGTKSLGDAADDISIPLRLTNTTARFQDAARTLNKNPQVTRVVGHSLGGAVALELQKDDPSLDTTTYGAPVVSTQASSQRHRHWMDPVAALDWGASTTVPGVNPHSYESLAARRHEFRPGTWKDGYLRNGLQHYFR